VRRPEEKIMANLITATAKALLGKDEYWSDFWAAFRTGKLDPK
jgi:hypothetical protein